MPTARAVFKSRVGSSSHGIIDAVLHSAIKIKRDPAKTQWEKVKNPNDCLVRSIKKETNCSKRKRPIVVYRKIKLTHASANAKKRIITHVCIIISLLIVSSGCSS